jgi:Domain of unknown function (DUF6436)
MNGKVKAAVVLLALWIAGSAAAFYWFFLGHYGVFDQQGLWQQQPLLPVQVQHKLKQQLVPDAIWQAVLITDSNCNCSSFATEHLLRMQQRQPNLIVKELELTEAKALGLTLGLDIIAAPLLLLFQNQQLLYAGPLATDLMCSDNASLLDDIINGTTRLPGFWLNGESTACRCAIE